MGSPGIVPFIIFGMATLEKDIQPPTHIAPKDTLTADRSWKWKSLKNLIILLGDTLRYTIVASKRFVNVIYMFFKFCVSMTKTT